MKIDSITPTTITLTLGAGEERLLEDLGKCMAKKLDLGIHWLGPKDSEWWKGWDSAAPGANGARMYLMRFTLTADHLTLLRHSYTGWQYTEFGAVEVDPKRPYGNSDVLGDLYEIFGVDTGDDGPAPEESKRLLRLHRETQVALEIILQTGSFEPGEYVNVGRDYSPKWQKTPTPSGARRASMRPTLPSTSPSPPPSHPTAPPAGSRRGTGGEASSFPDPPAARAAYPGDEHGRQNPQQAQDHPQARRAVAEVRHGGLRLPRRRG